VIEGYQFVCSFQDIKKAIFCALRQGEAVDPSQTTLLPSQNQETLQKGILLRQRHHRLQAFLRLRI